MKNVFKAIAVMSILSMTIATTPVSAETEVNTGFQRSSGGGDAPIIKAKWEMNDHANQNGWWYGDDDSSEEGAQFLPTGAWDTMRPIVFCAVATDPDGVSDINAVYADMYYPEAIAFHPMDPNHPDEQYGGTTENPDYGVSGCSEQVEDEILLTRLPKDEGYDLFCNRIRNNNNNLPEWNESGLYDYNEVCALDGELQKETAYVYCGVRGIRWEDPSGDYFVEVHAADKAGVDSEVVTNTFEYLELTSFEVDFNHVNYGNVKLNTHKIKNGDLFFNEDHNSDYPTVRNLGNTRLYMTVEQDDMGLGSTNGEWNVEWDGRVGSDAPFAVYDPYETVVLEDILDLSETEEMDFSILVKKFPLNSGNGEGGYSGDMFLGAKRAEHRLCWEDVN